MAKVLFIDPEHKRVEVIDLGGGWEAVRTLIGAPYLEPVMLTERFGFLVDEEGRLKTGQHCFVLSGQVFVGKCVFVQFKADDSGDFEDLIEEEEMRSRFVQDVAFLHAEFDYTPPPFKVVTINPLAEILKKAEPKGNA
jgi:hypothetical protein